MSDQVSKFDLHRTEFANSLVAVANSLRSCAQFADAFANIVADTPYSPEAAALLQGVTGASESGKGKRKLAHSPDEGEAPKRRKRNTKPKDPNAPKRPASSYILFQNDVRKEIKERHPNLSNADLMGVISEQWKKMSQEEKETYNQMMKDAKAVYSEEKKAYDSRHQADEVVADDAKAPQKEGTKSRASKPGATPGTSVPPDSKAKVLPNTDSSDEEESDDERAQVTVKKHETDSSDDEESSPEPKSRRTGSIQPKVKKHLK